mmetsp:Transcript_13433/g.38733  ORF Transcript_13433/g.38733 Transcript_13433/m.38733 type:complete len:462 (-) Transcript_13433:123-1508(-)|eukprot:CAMPEP_0176027380 /NCGR_PEP_ID=MMETSP0120_2-20121206/13425_1 /TAXON_ID=160619 /ORGANISM="Kryptoperidinium foliaceum, Strain CCMP 1326" /LENGTH=461 /DNA_ID=CAMNT_0017360583 /DNA_START=149 /DNA_END=1534 /DNA_ORIENTATION=+
MSTGNPNAKEGSNESAPLLQQQDRAQGGHAPPPAMTPEQAAAWMAQYNAYYYGDPNAQAAAGGAPPPYYYQGYPPPPAGQGYPVPPAQGDGAYPPPPSGYAPQYAAAPPQGTQRPPRAQRRASGSRSNPTTPSPSNIVRKTYSGEDPEKGGSAIPALSDIFSDSQPLLQQNSGAEGYGATAGNVYNAPPRASNKSANSGKAVPPVGLPRTGSVGDFKQHPLKSSGGGGSSRSHRRIASDIPRSHRRTGSGASLRHSTSSGNLRGKPTHRRADSTSSMLSNASRSSVVSNIFKSEFFGGVDEKGRVQMHFPFEAIRLVMVDPEQPTLRSGHLYLDGHQKDYDQFEEYHRLTEEANDGIIAPQWESLDKPANLCGCTCNNCNGCLGKKHLLPDTSYLLAVDENVFKKVMGEISDAHTMPCGLFFCGHHEDVAHPSILIAVIIVAILFACLFYFAIFTGDIGQT